MGFTSLQYLIFLPIVFGIYWATRTHAMMRRLVLLAAGIAFYAAWNIIPYLFVLYVATVDWALARAMGKTEDPRKRKLLVTLSVVSNLTVLGFFKYINLALETIGDGIALIDPAYAAAFFKGVTFAAGLIGIGMRDTRLDIILPLGLSFIVFQTLTYTIDVYRKDFSPRKSWIDVVVYLSFFPVIVCGPIMRARDFMPQLDKVPQLDEDAGARALLRIAKGLAKKLLIADFLSANLINRVFSSPELYSPIETWTAVFAYTLQIYYDFSAYSDIAIGSAALFGIKIKENFDRPYKATSLPDFWRRWHISLSNWLRDYLYIPLGGNRDGLVMTVRNVMITMILGGIWHGANWRMALWGMVHGIGLSMTRVFWAKKGMPDGTEPFWRVALGWFFTFMSVMLARVYFRAESMDQAHRVFAGLVGPGLEAPNVTPQIIFVLAVATAIHFGPSKLFDRIADLFVKVPIPVRAVALLVMALIVKKVASFDVQPFIYTQF